MKKLIAIFGGLTMLGLTMSMVFAATNWDTTGTYTVELTCVSNCGSLSLLLPETHTMNILTQDGDGNLTGDGTKHDGSLGLPWTLTGMVNGQDISLHFDFDGSDDFVDLTGTIGSDGMMSGTAVDNLERELTWVTTQGAAVFVRQGEITAPQEAEQVFGMVSFEAFLNDDDEDDVQWAVREGTCDAGVGTLWGNVDGHNDPYDWMYDADTYTHSFSSMADTTGWTPGIYCFVFNPTEDEGETDIRLTREFELVEAPEPTPSPEPSPSPDPSPSPEPTPEPGPVLTDKDQCKNGGWQDFQDPSFKNQGDCVSYISSSPNAKGNKKDNH